MWYFINYKFKRWHIEHALRYFIMKISLLTAPIACTFPIMQLSKLRYAFRHNIIPRFEYFFGLSTTNITKFTVTFNSVFYFNVHCGTWTTVSWIKIMCKTSEECNQEFFFQVILWCTPFFWLTVILYIHILVCILR